MSKNRKQHSPRFKAKAALVAIKNEETLAELAQRFGVHPTIISTWEKALREGVPDIFDKNHKSQKKMSHKFMNYTVKLANLRWKGVVLACIKHSGY